MNGTNYIINTTIDITRTGVTNYDKNDEDNLLKRNQQKNFDTLAQVISMRTIYEINWMSILESDPESILRNFGFGNFGKPVKIWSMEIVTDRVDALGENGEILIDDLNFVPIIPGLDSTVPAFPNFFITKGDIQNTLVRRVN